MSAQINFNCSIFVTDSYTYYCYVSVYDNPTTLNYGTYSGIIFNEIIIKNSICDDYSCLTLQLISTQYNYGIYFQKDISFLNVSMGGILFYIIKKNYFSFP